MDKLIEAIAQNLGTIGLLIFLAVMAILSVVREIARIRLDIARHRSSDLLNRRFASYGILWSQMKDLAIYSAIPFDEKIAESLRDRLSSWYFSADGGMLLSASARDFYFALQDTLTTLAGATLIAFQRSTDPRKSFLEVLNTHIASHPECVEAQNDNRPEHMPAEKWRSLCKVLTDDVLCQRRTKTAHLWRLKIAHFD